MNEFYEAAKALHAAGQLDEAVALYRRAVEAEPQDRAAHNMLGNALSDQGLWRQAAERYRRALEVDEGYASAHYNLGNALCTGELWAEAIRSYQRALELEPGRAAAHFNCGNAYNALGQPEAAVVCYRRALELDATDPDTAFNLGRTLHDLGRLDEAISAYQQAVQANPQYFRAHSNLATILFEARRPAEAVEARQRALELEPDSVEELLHLSLAQLGVGDFPAAEQPLRRALEINPQCGSAYELLGRILELVGRHQELAALAEQWLTAIPSDPRAAHMRAAWSGEATPARASDEYVRHVFDRFAPNFEDTLGKLDYQAPQLLCSRVVAERGSGGQLLEILDAGCGTGLCGPLLRPAARRLVGVDLSRGMLDVARQHGVYDELVEAELTAYLRQQTAAFDVLVSADTLVYFGDLEPVFAAAAQALRDNGYLAFTLEGLPADDSAPKFRLNAHGRYGHREAYILQSLAAGGFAVQACTVAVLRQEAGQPVNGYVVIATKTTVTP